MQTQVDPQVEIDRVLARLQQKGIGSTTKPVKWVDQHEMMRGRNNGYPRDMYHVTLDPRQAVNEDSENMLSAQGYGRSYIPKTHPKYMFRRNMSPVFSKETNKDFVGNDYVEEKLVKDAEAERKLVAQKPPSNCGPWLSSIALLEPLPDAPAENSDLAIARLEATIAELRRSQAVGVSEPSNEPLRPPMHSPSKDARPAQR